MENQHLNTKIIKGRFYSILFILLTARILEWLTISSSRGPVLSMTTLKPLTVWFTTTVENSWRDGNTRPPYLPPEKPVCRSRNNRTWHGTIDWFQTGKGVGQGYILSPCLFNFYAEYIMRNAGLDEGQPESRLQGEISITSKMQTIPL